MAENDTDIAETSTDGNAVAAADLSTPAVPSPSDAFAARAAATAGGPVPPSALPADRPHAAAAVTFPANRFRVTAPDPKTGETRLYWHEIGGSRRKYTPEQGAEHFMHAVYDRAGKPRPEAGAVTAEPVAEGEKRPKGLAFPKVVRVPGQRQGKVVAGKPVTPDVRAK